MNSTQVQTSFASIISFVAGILAAKFQFFDQATWLAIVTSIAGLIGAVWAGYASRPSALVSSLGSLESVDSKKLAQALDDPTMKAAAAATVVTPPATK